MLGQFLWGETHVAHDQAFGNPHFFEQVRSIRSCYFHIYIYTGIQGLRMKFGRKTRIGMKATEALKLAVRLLCCFNHLLTTVWLSVRQRWEAICGVKSPSSVCASSFASLHENHG